MSDYGALTWDDIRVLEDVLRCYKGRDRPLRFLEIGVHTGTTSRGIKHYCDKHQIQLEWYGLDNGTQNDGVPPFPGAKMVVGDSVECAHLLPDVIDVVFVDGNHSFNHVVLDTLLYGEKVPVGGCIIHHDCAPHVQQTMKDPHGPPTPRFHNSVLAALNAIGFFASQEWAFFSGGYDPKEKYGGMLAHTRIRECPKWEKIDPYPHLGGKPI